MPFLDILSSHGQDCSIDTSVFRKRTHTDRYLSFSSHQPLAHKRSVVNTLFRRAKALSSDPRNQSEEEAHLRVVLKRNGYPKKFVSRSATGMTVLKMDEDDMDEKPKVTVVSETSLHPRSVRDHEKDAGKVDIRARTKVHKTLRQIHVKPKDQVLVRQQTGVVYRTLCKDYLRVYVGQTGRTLECRLKEHKKAAEQGKTETSMGCGMGR